jgi:hypothetical protein
MTNWSLEGEFEERLGPDHMAITFNSGTARERSLRWKQAHGLEKCHAADIHTGLADLIDAAALDDDDEDLVNREWFERAMRWQYGIEKVFELVKCESDYKSAKPKTRWALLEYYHPSAANKEEASAPAADQKVRDQLQERALMEKYMTKAGIATG